MLFLLPATVYAGGRTLYETSENVITLAESTGICLADKGACTRDDILALQEDARSCLRDCIELLCSRDTARRNISADQIQVLYAKLNTVNALLVHSNTLDWVCNDAIAVFMKGVQDLSDALSLWLLSFVIGGFPVSTLLMTGVIIVEMGLTAITSLGLLLCFFWWL